MIAPAPLAQDEDRLGLLRVVVPTAAGAITSRVSGRTSETATVLLHGAAGSWATWVPLLTTAGPVLSDVVAVDLPGWGESPGPVPSRDALARAIAEVARSLGYTRWTLVGHSLGGAIALDVAARFPAETRGVVLVSPSGIGVRDAVRRPLRGGVRLPWLAGMLLAMRILRALGPVARPLLRVLRATGMLRILARPLFRRPSEVTRAVSDALADEIRPAAFLAAAAAARVDDEAVWRSIHCPVVSIRGEHDVFARSDDDADLAARVAGVRGIVLPDAGHFAHVERPDAVRTALDSLLVPRAGGSTTAGG